MDPDDLSARIAAAEDEIETLAEAIGRSRRIVLLSRCAGLAGGAWFVASIVGLAPADTVGLVTAIALAIGGMVFAGSSHGTIRDTQARIDELEKLREQLIDAVSPVETSVSEPRLVALRSPEAGPPDTRSAEVRPIPAAGKRPRLSIVRDP